MSESNSSKSYHQVNHLSTNRLEAQARKAVACEGHVSPAEKIAGETRAEKSVCFPQAWKSVMVRTCDRVPEKFVDVSCKTVTFLALDISKN